jgi:hypothetical protein
MTHDEEVLGREIKSLRPMALIAVLSAIVTALGINIVGPAQALERIDQRLAAQAKVDSLRTDQIGAMVRLIYGNVAVACQLHPYESSLAGLPCASHPTVPLQPKVPRP